MNLISVRMFFSRGDVRVIIFGTATGAILQAISKRYLKNHPEFLKDSPESKETPPRGGAVVEFVTSKVIAQTILAFLAEHGLTAGLASSIGVVISRIPMNSVSTYLRDALPHNLPHLDKKKFVMTGGESLFLDQCDQNLQYLFNILQNEEIPYEEKEKVAHSILTKFLNLKTASGRRNFVLCIVFLLYIFATTNHSALYIMMKNLIKAIREGKIPVPMARLIIIRKLKKRGVPIDPELAELVAS